MTRKRPLGLGSKEPIKTSMDYEGQSPTYGGSINSLAGDDNFIYAGGSTTYKIRKYNKSDLTLVNESPSYGANIQVMAVDDNFVYVGGSSSSSKINKYNKSDLTLVISSPTAVGTARALTIDEYFIYVGSSNTNGVRKYNKSDLKLVNESPVYGGAITSLAVDDNFIYAGGITTNKIRKYNKVDLTLVNESPDYGGNIYSLVVDGDFIYAGGTTTNKIRRYNKVDLTFVDESPNYGGTIQAMVIDDNFIYAGGTGAKYAVRKYNKSDLKLICASPTYGTAIVSLVFKDNFVYASGGGTIQAIRKYSIKSDKFGYYGKYRGIATPSELIALAGITEGVTKDDADNSSEDSITWLKFNHNYKTLFVADRTIHYGVSWNHLSSKELVFGKVVDIDGQKYLLRLLQGSNVNPSSVDGDLNNNDEWNSLIAQFTPNTEDSHFGSDVVNSNGGNYTWCQETITPEINNAVIRGETTVTDYSQIEKSTASTSNGYRPVLEVL